MLRSGTPITVLVVALAMLLTLGCGKSQTRDSDAHDVRAAVASYFRAIDAADGDSICSRLTGEAKRDIARLQRTSCVKAIAAEARRLPGALNAYEVTQVRAEGQHASVVLKDKGSGLEEQMKLTKVAGSWKISDAPGLGQ